MACLHAWFIPTATLWARAGWHLLPTVKTGHGLCAPVHNRSIHCKTAEVHVLLNFKSTESGLMTNVITSTSF
jgi:hypothetical protein